MVRLPMHTLINLTPEKASGNRVRSSVQFIYNGEEFKFIKDFLLTAPLVGEAARNVPSTNDEELLGSSLKGRQGLDAAWGIWARLKQAMELKRRPFLPVMMPEAKPCEAKPCDCTASGTATEGNLDK
ncbi:conserved hypothetical protein [Ricinus communis]|uniref:Uncharacterized protein n=1 Tax=Ricinus communis TaxID=3988 RepID=B9T3C6_RICCO|nr:conserved hypothetical protein [Ricinus communis]